jgi:prepilin-type N-terminal cleavage/methylation domain-containing protein
MVTAFRRGRPPENRPGPGLPGHDARRGFSLLELIIAIFILGMVLATFLLLMAHSMNIVQRSNEAAIATALAQYQEEFIQNIDFPSTYWNRGNLYGTRVASEPYNPAAIGTNAGLAPEFVDNYTVRRFSVGYTAAGNITVNEDETMRRRVDIFVWKKRGQNGFYRLIQRSSVYRTRNGHS